MSADDELGAFAKALHGHLDLFSEDRTYPHFVEGGEIRQTVSTEGLSLRLTGKRGRARYVYGQLRSQEYVPDWQPRYLH